MLLIQEREHRIIPNPLALLGPMLRCVTFISDLFTNFESWLIRSGHDHDIAPMWGQMLLHGLPPMQRHMTPPPRVKSFRHTLFGLERVRQMWSRIWQKNSLQSNKVEHVLDRKTAYTFAGHALATPGAAIFVLLGLTPAQADSCSSYGPGFTRVEGGSGCLRFNGHVRVDDGGLHASSLSGWNSHGARPASLNSGGDDTGHARVRLRPGLMGYAGPTMR